MATVETIADGGSERLAQAVAAAIAEDRSPGQVGWVDGPDGHGLESAFRPMPGVTLRLYADRRYDVPVTMRATVLEELPHRIVSGIAKKAALIRAAELFRLGAIRLESLASEMEG